MINNISETTKIYKVAIYARLSREDESATESDSIKNQIDIITRFVLEKDWIIADTYCDDGYTGTNFDRPAFKRMMADIETGKINMIVTKDFSRLGRDIIETNNYIQKVFPTKGIRYVTVNDGIDTNDDNSYFNSTFLSLFNDLYPRDISKKVRTVMDTKRKNGEFIGAFAPYGYKKSKENRNKLIIDEEAAAIVRRIFNMYLSGIGVKGIAKILNQEMIPCPSEYKRKKYRNYNNAITKTNLWKSDTIKSFLISPTYIGCIAQGKYKKINHKVNMLKTLAKDKWIIVENTHEPIIDKETFDEVQNILQNRSNTKYSTVRKGHLLTGLIYCGDCGQKMTFTKSHSSQTYYAICSKYKRFGKDYCTRHSIGEDNLVQFVIKDIRKLAKQAVDEKKLMITAQKDGLMHKEKDIDLQLKKIESRLNEIKWKMKTLYEDKLRGIVSEEDYMDFSKDYNDERINLVPLQSELLKNKENANRINNDIKFIINYVKQFTEFQEIDRTAITRLIEKIEIFEDKRIVIHYKFKRP